MPENSGSSNNEYYVENGILKKRMTRRAALSTGGKVVIGVAAAVAVGGGAYAAYISSIGAPNAPSSTTAATSSSQTQTSSSSAASSSTSSSVSSTKPPLISLFPGPYIFPQVISQWQQLNGQTIQNTTLDLNTEAPTIIGTGGKGWDVTITTSAGQVERAGVIQPVPKSRLTRWDPTKIADIFVNPDKYLNPLDSGNLKSVLSPSDKPDYLWGSIPLYNFDSVAYLPEFLTSNQEVSGQKSISYGATVDPQWKGKSSNQDVTAAAFGEPINYLSQTNQMTAQGPAGDPVQADVDKVAEWYTPIMQGGQYRTLWGTYGDGINILATKEVVITSTWQPVVNEVRRAGTPCYYAQLQNGIFFWFNMEFASTGTNKLDDVISYMNFTMSPWWVSFITIDGYTVPTYTYPDVEPLMGSEFYGWQYNGQATHRPIDQIVKVFFPDKGALPNRLAQALFLPDWYGSKIGWQNTGSPDPNGNIQDRGSVVQKQTNTTWWGGGSNLHHADYMQQVWDRLKAMRPSS